MARNDKKSETEAPEYPSVSGEETLKELFARMHAMGADPLFPEGRKQNLAPIREYPWDERPSEEEPDAMSEIDESKFPYGYVPDHLKERVENWRSLSIGERLELTSELSLAAWEKIGVVYDPTKPTDKTIRRFRRKENGELEPY